jgi:hypothetical protein
MNQNYLNKDATAGKTVVKSLKYLTSPFARAGKEVKRRFMEPTLVGKYSKKGVLEPESSLTAMALRPLGKERSKKVAEKLTTGPLSLDERLGRVITGNIPKHKKPGFLKGLFTRKEHVPIHKGSKIKKEVYFPSFLGPWTKGVAIATPFVMAHQVEKLLNKKGGKDMSEKIFIKKDLLEKTASLIEKVGEERDKYKSELNEIKKHNELRKQAEELAFSMISKGLIPQFASHGEYAEKIAGLMKEDLAIAKKAIELNNKDLGKLGEISNVRGRGGNALEEFILS